MFVRKLRHKNGKIYIQVVEKVSKKYIVRQSFGSVTNNNLENLVSEAELWIKNYQGQQEFDFENEKSIYSKHNFRSYNFLFGERGRSTCQ